MPYFNSKGNVMDFDAHSDQEDNARTKNMLIDEATLPKNIKTKLKIKDSNERGDGTGLVKIRSRDINFGFSKGSAISKDDMAFGKNNKKAPKRRESGVTNTTTAKKGVNDEGAMINQYVIIKTLGKGSFATVLLCKDTKTSEQFAIKKMNKK